MVDVSHNLAAIRSQIPEGATLVAVSKFHPAEMLREAYDAGQRVFGESRVQELLAKRDCLPADIEWHFIGHLQTNKVRAIAPFVSLIHAVDSLRLLEEISRQGERVGRVIPCLLQLHVAREETKFGFSPDELLSLSGLSDFKGARIDGLMCMASNTDDMGQVESEFALAWQVFRELKESRFADAPHFRHRSWGMSGDWPVALRQGATLVRIGTAIFGERM